MKRFTKISLILSGGFLLLGIVLCLTAYTMGGRVGDLSVSYDSEKHSVVTGDQIKGYGVSYKGTGDALIESVAETVGKLLKPVTDRHIPFAVTFGNHDRQVGISNKDQFEKIYKALPGCVGEQAEGIDGGGTYNIPILSSDGERTAFNLYLFDSGTDAKGGGYEPFDPQIIDWYRKKRDELKVQNGDYIPSLVFQHIPMFEHYNVLKRVGKREKGAIPAFRIHKGEHYKIDETKCVEGSVLLEPPSIPDINTGEFEALSEKDDVLGVYVGHDHKNSYVGKVGNIDVGFTQSTGFNVYGNGKQRGVRCFVLDENDPRKYKTYTKTYEQLCDGKLNTPIKDAIWRVVPTTVDMAKPMIAKALAAIARAAAPIVNALKFLSTDNSYIHQDTSAKPPGNILPGLCALKKTASRAAFNIIYLFAPETTNFSSSETATSTSKYGANTADNSSAVSISRETLSALPLWCMRSASRLMPCATVSRPPLLSQWDSRSTSLSGLSKCGNAL